MLPRKVVILFYPQNHRTKTKNLRFQGQNGTTTVHVQFYKLSKIEEVPDRCWPL